MSVDVLASLVSAGEEVVVSTVDVSCAVSLGHTGLLADDGSDNTATQSMSEATARCERTRQSEQDDATGTRQTASQGAKQVRGCVGGEDM